MSEFISIDDHVNSIIKNNRPVLAQTRINRTDLDCILRRLKERVDNGLAPASLLELRPYDFHGTMNLWAEQGVKDYELARELTDRVVQTIMKQKRWDFIQFVQNVTQKMFCQTPINQHGTKSRGMIKVYNEIYQNAVIDLVQHDERYSEWRDLRKPDFKKEGRLTDAECRELTHLRIQKLMKDNGWDFVQLIRNMKNPPKSCGFNGWNDAFEKPFNRYGTTLAGVIDRHRDSAAEVVLDLVIHDDRYEEYRDLRSYDFPDQRNIWTRKDGVINYELAREATGVLVEKLGITGMALPKIIKQLTDEVFKKTEINRYGTRLGGMIQQAYSECVRKAIQDWHDHRRQNDAVV